MEADLATIKHYRNPPLGIALCYVCPVIFISLFGFVSEAE
jgi:hypothetical protein